MPTSVDRLRLYSRRGEAIASRRLSKPDADTAAQYVLGEYLWNSGMFLMQASSWLAGSASSARYFCMPAYAFERGSGYGFSAPIVRRLRLAQAIPSTVMEPTDRAVVVPLDAGWSDIGAWSAIWAALDQDAAGNALQGDVYAHDTRNTLLVSSHRMPAAVGIDDLIVVETPDAVLVAHKDRAQDVKEIVSRLKADRRPEHLMHRRVHRPWGSYEGLDVGERFQVKRLIVKPGAALSLQLHHHRAEHWIVVRGTARVTRGDDVFLLQENQSAYIPVGARHRLENPGDTSLEIIEVQTGDYLGEDDIVRFEDIYGRHAGR